MILILRVVILKMMIKLDAEENKLDAKESWNKKVLEKLMITFDYVLIFENSPENLKIIIKIIYFNI